MAYSSIVKPTDYFNALLYTGNGSTNALTGVGFQPDWVWLKGRSNGDGSRLYDAVRGTTKEIYSDAADAESTNSNGLTAFGTDGFTLGSSSGTNGSSKTYVAWNWLGANGTASNSDGSITSTVSANTTAGFSIVSFTGTGSNATIGHGLGSAPKMIIIKNRSATDDWAVYHGSLATDKYLRLNQSTTQETGTPMWNDTAPTTSVFSVGTYHNSNGPSENMIAYCFAEKKGYSKFGSYVGNNNDDGTFVYLGFKPAFLLIKITDTQTDNWILQDNKRNTFNLSTSQRLRANTSGAEFSSSNEIDLLSNGFKVHGADGEINGSGASYIYLAFAENPFVANDSGTAVPVVAR